MSKSRRGSAAFSFSAPDPGNPEPAMSDLPTNSQETELRSSFLLDAARRGFIQQASDIGHVEPVVEEEVANRNASLGLGIEIHAVSRYIKCSLTHLEAISSSFTVSLFHLDTFEKRPKFHGNQNRERIAFYRRQRGAPLPAPRRSSSRTAR